MKLAELPPREAHLEVRRLFSYDPATGAFLWAVSRQGGYATPGGVAGSVDENGYVTVRVNGHRYSIAKLIYLWVRGHWPTRPCVYKDGNRQNLAWDNLSFDGDRLRQTDTAKYMRALRSVNKEVDRRIRSTPGMMRAYYAADSVEARKMRAEVRKDVRAEWAWRLGGNEEDMRIIQPRRRKSKKPWE